MTQTQIFLEQDRICEFLVQWHQENPLASHTFIGKVFAIWQPSMVFPHRSDYQPVFDKRKDPFMKGWSTASHEEFQWFFTIAQHQNLLTGFQAFSWEALWHLNDKWRPWQTQLSIKAEAVFQKAVRFHQLAASEFKSQKYPDSEFLMARHWFAIATLLLKSRQQPALFEFDERKKLLDKLKQAQCEVEYFPVKLILIEAEVNIIRSMPIMNISRLETLLGATKNLYQEATFNFSNLLKRLAELEKNISKILGVVVNQQDLELRLAKTCERFVSECPGLPFNGDFLLNAARHYKQAGKEFDEERMKMLMSKEEWRLPTNTYPSLIPISQEDITKLQNQILGQAIHIDDAFSKVCKYLEYNALDWDTAVQSLSKDPSIVSRIAQKQVYRHNRPISILPQKEEVDSFPRDILLSWYRFNVSLLFKESKRKFPNFKKEDLIYIFHSSPWVAEEMREIFERICERYFAEDFISTIHIILPQIEVLLRMIVKQSNQSTTTLSTTGLKEVSLEELLFRGEKIFGIEISRFLKLLLSKEGSGLNLRNDGAHGFFTQEEYTRENTEVCLQIIMFLAKYRLRA